MFARRVNQTSTSILFARRVLVNVDETSVCLFQGQGLGNLFVTKDKKAVQNVKSSLTRLRMSHVAFITDVDKVQPSLPQFFIVNQRTLTLPEYSALQLQLPTNVRLIRAKSAWVTNEVCARMVRFLAADLAPFANEFQIILFWDALRQHFSKKVLQTYLRLNVWHLYIPARMTWLVQSHTHAFSAMKAFAAGTRSNEVRLTADR